MIHDTVLEFGTLLRICGKLLANGTDNEMLI